MKEAVAAVVKVLLEKVAADPKQQYKLVDYLLGAMEDGREEFSFDLPSDLGGSSVKFSLPYFPRHEWSLHAGADHTLILATGD